MATTENTYTLSNTSTGPYTFTFPYIKEADVKVSKNNVALDLTTDYTQATTSITLVATPVVGDEIRIYRDTDTAGLAATFYPGSAIRSSDLNDNFTQNLYVTQEVENDADTAITDATTAISTADAATITANTADTNASAAVTTANTASTNASAAVTTANTASTNASAAVTTANTASTNASAAVVTANTASTTATAATTAANAATTASNTATTTANTASATATTADTNASAAVTTANTASTNASAAVSTANTADTNASAAVVTANQASADVAAAVLYTSVANKAALEALTPSEDGYYQVTDSSSLANATWGIYTLSGITGSYPNTQLSGITTKLGYTHSSKTFAYSAYTVNDADDRYMVGPASSGNANEVLTTNGSGVFTWEVGGNVTIDAGNFDTGASLVSSTVTYDGGEFT